jgi:DNA-binding response OmpR family regulator
VSKQTLLLVDGDARSLRVLEVSLRKAGFSVTTAENVRDAMDKLAVRAPELIISEIRFDDGDGFDLRRRVQENTEWQEIPFVFLTSETAIEYKIKGLELGVDDYLTKPIYIKEIVARIGILLQKKQRSRIEERKDVRTRFVGRLSDMPVVDVIQTIEISRKSGVIQFVGEREQQAAIYFRDGKVIDAEAGALQGEDAVYRLLTWSDGDFEVMFRTVRRREVITVSSQGLLMEGMRRLDEWTLLLEQLPSLQAKFEVDTDELVARLGDIPDGNNRILRLIDGKRSLLEIIDACDIGDLECLQVIARLYFEGLLVDVTGRDDLTSPPPRRSNRLRAQSAPLDDGKSTSGQMDVPAEAVSVAQVAATEFATQPTPAQFTAEGTPKPFENQTTPSAFEPQTTPIMTPAQHEQAQVLGKITAAVMANDFAAQQQSAEPEPEPGPLLGGYRKSSLRLIDEAVAAAEAIDPGFAIDDADAQHWWSTRPPLSTDQPPRAPVPVPAPAASTEATSVARIALVKAIPRAPARNVAAEAAAAVAAGSASEPEIADAVPAEVRDGDDEPSAPLDNVIPPVSQTGRTETSAMRMISSLGKETAEVAGELTKPAAQPASEKDGTARQMVTILPRRITREIPESAVEQLNQVAAAASAKEHTAEASAALELPAVAQTINVPGGTTRNRGNGRLIAGLGLLAAGIFAIVAYTQCSKSHKATAPVAHVPADANTTSPAIVVDGGSLAPSDAPTTVVTVDASTTLVTTDAAPSKKYRDLLSKARAAIDEGDAETALRLATESILDKPTGKGYITKADALRRLGRTEEAIAAINNALRMASDFAPAWEMKGRILWGAKRTAEATSAFERFLELEPKGERADGIRALMGK